MPAGLAAAALVAGHARQPRLRRPRRRHQPLRPPGRRRRLHRRAASPRGGSPSPLATAALCLLLLALVAGPGPALGAALGLAAGHARRLAWERRLGGYTGDCLGATQQLSERPSTSAMLAWL